MLRTEVVPGDTPITKMTFSCMACKEDFNSQNELDVHSTEMHSHLIVEDKKQPARK